MKTIFENQEVKLNRKNGSTVIVRNDGFSYLDAKSEKKNLFLLSCHFVIVPLIQVIISFFEIRMERIWLNLIQIPPFTIMAITF